MKRLLLAAVAAFSIGVAHADTVYDPLHGCTTSGCTEANIGGNDVTPITTATNFGTVDDEFFQLADERLIIFRRALREWCGAA